MERGILLFLSTSESGDLKKIILYLGDFGMAKQNNHEKLQNIIDDYNERLSVENSENGWASLGRKMINLAAKSVLILTNLTRMFSESSTLVGDIDENFFDGNSEVINSTEILNQKKKIGNRSEATDDILNLQYFFPCCDQFLKTNSEHQICLVICGQDSDLERAKSYLFAQSLIRKRLKIYVCNSERLVGLKNNPILIPLHYSEKNIGSFFPLLRIGESLTTEDGQVVSEGMHIQELSYATTFFRDYIDKEGSTEQNFDGTQQALLLNAGYNQITKITSNLRGDLSNNILLDIRNSLLKDFWNYVKKDISHLPLLTQLIWLYILRYLSEQKEIMTGENGGTLHWERIDLALWDAIGYAEGILQLLENSELHSCLHAGYFTMIFHDIGLRRSANLTSAAVKRERLFRRYRAYRNEAAFLPINANYYLEFNITDYAVDDFGKAKGITINAAKSLMTLFSGDFSDTDKNDINSIIHHYGMPLFHKMILLNGGRFFCSTPAKGERIDWYYANKDKNKNSIYDTNKDKEIIPGDQIWTTYHIILPVTHRNAPHVEQFISDRPMPLFDPIFLKKQPTKYKHKLLSRQLDIGDSPNSIKDKQKVVRDICDLISKQIICSEAVYVLDLRRLNTTFFDLYIKGLFCYFAFRFVEKSKEGKLLLRIVFSHKFALCEFVRRAGIFYGKVGENNWMTNVQMALCIASDQKDNSKLIAQNSNIWLILAGKDLSTAYLTAKHFAHYSLKDVNALLPQIQYLTRTKENKNIQAQPLFPFDLVEQNGMTSQFLEQMQSYLDRNLQERDFGCKLQNAHIRLGSKIHLADFYVAELLFHSIGHIYRFAYLIAEDLVNKLENLSLSEKLQPLFLVGYEGYSSILVEQVAELLRLAMEKDSPERIIHIQYQRRDDGQENIYPVNDKIDNKISGKANCVFIVPVGTTLSTIYKVKNALFHRYFKQFEMIQPFVLGCYSVIVVGDSSCEKQSSNYWIEEKGVIELKPEENTDSDNLTVRYFLMPKTDWFSPTKCKYCANDNNSFWERNLTDIPLAHVDRTSTLPNIIFPLKKKDIRGISFQLNSQSDKEENDNRLFGLKGNVQYGHISMGSNHFQFYIDYANYYINEQKKCQEWLKSLRGKVDANAFNIIVSPRSENDCLFVKNTVDIVFQHSLRLLFLPLESVFREDIRAKFSYITEEYLTTCNSDFCPKINVYYVDYTIVSGGTLQRAKNLVNMLLQTINTPNVNNISLFHKIILLVNRSNYDTISTFISEPNKNFLAYATLAVPNFNTYQGKCPACDLVALYTEISKCCATNELYWYFQRLTQKHQLRSVGENQIWRKKIEITDAHQLQFLCQHLFEEDRDAYQKVLDKMMRAFNEWKEIFNKKYVYGDEGQRRIADLSLVSLFPSMIDGDEQIEDINKYQSTIISQREWRRIFATHQAMLLQESLARNGWEEEKTNGAIWELIRDELKQYNSTFHQREWLISYLKIFSRGYLAKLAPIRKSIYRLLKLVLLTLTSVELNEDDLDQGWRDFFGTTSDCESEINFIKKILTINDNIKPNELLQMYQLYFIVSKRLCDLQSDILLQYNMLLRIQKFLEKLKVYRKKEIKKSEENNIEDSTHALILMMPLPTDEQMQIHYVCLVKWAVMSSAEESKAFALQNLTKLLLSQKNSDYLLDCSRLGEVLRMENTRLVYTGIKRINESCRSKASWDSLISFVKERREACINKENKEEPYILQNPLADLFRFLDADGKPDDYQIAAMLGFYRLIKKLEDGSVMEEQKNYIEEYSDLCFHMSKIVSSDGCCLIHQQNGRNQLLAQSSKVDDKKINNLIDIILEESEEKLKQNQLYNTVEKWEFKNSKKIKKGDNRDISALVLALHIQRRRDIQRRQKIYIILTYFEKSSPNIAQSHFVLFMRQPLQKLLERDIYALHHFRLTYEDVMPLSENKKRRPLTLLHLTDLHITVQNEAAIIKLVKENANALKKDNPDLLVITGDIVQGNSTAVDLEKNYKAAGRIIQQIAAVIWPESLSDDLERNNQTTFPRPDWRKRVVVIPGNHDYASMNELSATHFLRTTNGGTPVLKDGSPMSRFSYYIQFLQENLYIDMSYSIQNNLNEIREYPELGVRIIALNSVAEVGPLRNNKVQLDQDFISKLQTISAEGDEFVNICLVHHTACYKPNYIYDQYYEKGLSFASVQNATEIIKTYRQAYEAKFEKPNRWEEEKETIKRKLDELHEMTAYNEMEEHHKGSALYNDIEYLENHWDMPTNERCQQIFLDFERHEKMANQDYENYINRLKEINNKIHIDVILGGHIHQAACTKENFCIQGPRFYQKQEPADLWFGRLKLLETQDNGLRFSYEFHPKDITRKPLEMPIEWNSDNLHK